MDLSAICITVWIYTHPELAWSVSCPGEYPSRRSKFWPPWFTQVSITHPISKVPNCNTSLPEIITFNSRRLVVVNSFPIEFCRRSLPKTTFPNQCASHRTLGYAREPQGDAHFFACKLRMRSRVYDSRITFLGQRRKNVGCSSEAGVLRF